MQAAGNDFQIGLALREKWAQLANEGRALLRRDGDLGRNFLSYGQILIAFKESINQVVQLLDLNAEKGWGGDSSPGVLVRIRTCISRWQESISQLRTWCAWRRARSEAMEHNLSPLIKAYEEGDIQSVDLPKVFERSYTQWWLSAVTDNEIVLNQFFSPEHERKILQFRSVDDRYMELTKLMVQAKLAKKVPAANLGHLPNSEMGVLKREVGKKRRHKSIRQLLQEIPNLLPRIKPCLLMSPMSVAQYLDSNYPPFDLVVFDEASQIPIWDAIGAIARGKQAVIVGDPRQLPPTSFFQRVDLDEEIESDDVVEDLESILDDCIAAQIPWLHLDWHYRSRHESLITFSNYHFYGNRLMVFPSPYRKGLGVSWHHVPGGVYDKGKTRTNLAEAKAIVSEIVRRLQAPELSRFTIGVVTFNQAQQNRIEDLLDVARAETPELDQFFSEDLEEPVFVKNLENVQGDERDVILFSVCYGPDMLGRVSMNFGPMNKEGGERRLNVAITRARREVLVFSTLKADQINLSKTRAIGVKHLKNFLEYADKGPTAIAEAIETDLDSDFDSPFEEAVFDAIVKLGWEVHKQVGCAGYRIDLAVVDPESHGRYLLGIECDGANYHRSKTARDRDKLRESVLRDLGWELHRIWSTDWWTNPEQEIRKIERAIERAREIDQNGVYDIDEREVEEAEGREVFASSLVSGSSKPSNIDEFHPEQELIHYKPLIFYEKYGSIETFYESRSTPLLREKIVQIVEYEGPISLNLAANHISHLWGIKRVTKRVLERVLSVIPKDIIKTQKTSDGYFLWPKDIDPSNYDSFRVPDSSGGGSRQANDIPIEEVENALVYLLKQNVNAPLDELVRGTARLFGFNRVGRMVNERIRKSIKNLINQSIFVSDGEFLRIN